MGMWYFKQPNGLYGRFSTIVDTTTHENMTEKQLLRDMTDRFGKYDADVINFDKFLETYDEDKRKTPFYIHKFEDVLKDMRSGNEDTESARKKLILMGMPEEEANKYYFMDYSDSDDFEPFLIKKDN